MTSRSGRCLHGAPSGTAQAAHQRARVTERGSDGGRVGFVVVGVLTECVADDSHAPVQQPLALAMSGPREALLLVRAPEASAGLHPPGRHPSSTSTTWRPSSSASALPAWSRRQLADPALHMVRSRATSDASRFADAADACRRRRDRLGRPLHGEEQADWGAKADRDQGTRTRTRIGMASCSPTRAFARARSGDWPSGLRRALNDISLRLRRRAGDGYECPARPFYRFAHALERRARHKSTWIQCPTHDAGDLMTFPS